MSLLGLLMDYWICKGFLLNVYRLPENISEDIAKPSILSLEMLPLVYLCGALQFGYKLSDSTDIVHFVANFFSYGITIFFLLLCVVSYLLFCRTAPQAPVLQLYSQKKLAFGFNYETCNPVTRLSGDIKYLYEAMKGSRGEQESQLISLLISSSRDSKAAFEAQKHKVNRIKHLLRRRLTIKEDGQELITLNLCDNHGGT